MKLRITASLSALALSATAIAATPPALILCTPDDFKRVGIENIDGASLESQLFEYGGKVSITKKGSINHYSYGTGQDFYKIKDKTPFSSDFLHLQLDLFIVTNQDLTNNSGFLYLDGDMTHNFYHIDLSKKRYYGVIREFGAAQAYAGSCTVLKE